MNKMQRNRLTLDAPSQNDPSTPSGPLVGALVLAWSSAISNLHPSTEGLNKVVTFCGGPLGTLALKGG